jgi:hypothetical protein
VRRQAGVGALAAQGSGRRALWQRSSTGLAWMGARSGANCWRLPLMVAGSAKLAVPCASEAQRRRCPSSAAAGASPSPLNPTLLPAA